MSTKQQPSDSNVALRLPSVTRGELFTVEIDGQPFQAYAGESVAAVLLAAGFRTFFRAGPDQAPHRLFCGMGVCHQCLVTIDGDWNLRACMTEARPDMQITTRAS